jgi:hypothetical protein
VIVVTIGPILLGVMVWFLLRSGRTILPAWRDSAHDGAWTLVVLPRDGFLNTPSDGPPRCAPTSNPSRAEVSVGASLSVAFARHCSPDAAPKEQAVR